MNSTNKPLILVTNDDGITAPGLRTLISVMNELGEVWVVAPDSPQSGMGHAITVDATIFCEKVKIDEGPQSDREWACSGTPVDCVKLAISKILPRRPDLCVSGINHGANSSINVIYSGTMSAAVEAGIEKIPAIGFSLCDFSWNADFKPAEPYIRKITEQVLANPMPEGIILNVNIPNPESGEIKGTRICRQAEAVWSESYDARISPNGKKYYWLTGKFNNLDHGEDTDEKALSEGYVSIVPIRFDMTDYKLIDTLKDWNL